MLNKRKIPKTIRVKRKKFITEYINNKTVIHIGCTGGLLGPDNEKSTYRKLQQT